MAARKSDGRASTRSSKYIAAYPAFSSVPPGRPWLIEPDDVSDLGIEPPAHSPTHGPATDDITETAQADPRASLTR